MGGVPELSPRVIAAHIHAYFQIQADVLEAMPLPTGAFNAERVQYDAAKILSHLENKSFEGYEKIIAVLGRDLFVPVFSYVMGEARQDGRCALISLFRLEDDLPTGKPVPPQLIERCAKAALHEIGHLFNLIHCSDPLCLMHLAGDARELDRRSFNLCRYCKLFLVQRLAQYRNVTEPDPAMSCKPRLRQEKNYPAF